VVGVGGIRKESRSLTLPLFLILLTDVERFFDFLHFYFKSLYIFTYFQIVFEVSKVLLHRSCNGISNDASQLFGLVINMRVHFGKLIIYSLKFLI
jgi:uncharacterized membrane protein YagU involved in acid resistance